MVYAVVFCRSCKQNGALDPTFDHFLKGLTHEGLLLRLRKCRFELALVIAIPGKKNGPIAEINLPHHETDGMMVDFVDELALEKGCFGIQALVGQSLCKRPMRFAKRFWDILPCPLGLVRSKKFRLVHFDKVQFVRR